MSTQAHPLRIPLLIALATAAGLIAGLLGEGAWNVAAWVGLAVPLVPAVRVLTRR